MDKPVGARTILCLKFHNIKGVDHVYDPFECSLSLRLPSLHPVFELLVFLATADN